MLKLEIAVVEPGNHLPLAHRVPGPYETFGDIAVKRCRHDALHRTFDHGLGRNTVVSSGHGAEKRNSGDCQCNQLGARMSRSKQDLRKAMHGAAATLPDTTLIVSLQSEDRSQQPADGLAKFDGLAV